MHQERIKNCVYSSGTEFEASIFNCIHLFYLPSNTVFVIQFNFRTSKMHILIYVREYRRCNQKMENPEKLATYRVHKTKKQKTKTQQSMHSGVHPCCNLHLPCIVCPLIYIWHLHDLLSSIFSCSDIHYHEFNLAKIRYSL
jgi:hypothetical protein